ncbi:serine acetyltransferase [Galbibacter sp. PAP.153]|uniref:serine O-acetyltransferase n=1 Tax=Galbibacter sp. PAP.153 TaxID=3104623 RepID=UPI00300B7EAD
MERPPVLLYRLGNFFYRKKIFILGALLTWINRLIFSTFLPSSASIGKNFKIGYLGLGTIIHKNAKIGDNCTVAQNVTIGRNIGEKKVPVIGNNVYIGTGSVVFGEIIIGDNVIIGANSLVNKDIPSNKIAYGNPVKIVRDNTRKK